jgi:murein DD-endopeptidase MepM/ murein hydrolase activator NlpD
VTLRLQPHRPRRRRLATLLVLAAITTLVTAALGLAYRALRPATGRLGRLRQYWSNPQAHAEWAVRAGEHCGTAPFVMPTDGLIGFLWGDSFYPGHQHQGLDIFGPTGPDGLGQTPVVAAYDGYLTRLPEWRSAVIVRIPDDPLLPGRTIWTYYIHMADADGRSYISDAFPAGTRERFVTAGTLLGYQGNYSADPDNPTGMHLHFSIVLDDGQGRFRNELDIGNTLDPSPYLGVAVRASTAGSQPTTCASGD